MVFFLEVTVLHSNILGIPRTLRLSFYSPFARNGQNFKILHWNGGCYCMLQTASNVCIFVVELFDIMKSKKKQIKDK